MNRGTHPPSLAARSFINTGVVFYQPVKEMKRIKYVIILLAMGGFNAVLHAQERSVTVPFILDHNRMIVEAQFQRSDGSWCKAKLWVDTGNPEFFISEEFARELGITIVPGQTKQEIPAPAKVTIGGMAINFGGVPSSVEMRNTWIFNAIHNDGNIPSTVLKNYHIIFDYPLKQLTIAEPGILKPRGERSPATVNPANGIIQLDAVLDGERYSFALDNGASFSFVSDSMVNKLVHFHPDWPSSRGAVGCANIWGCWPEEGKWPMVRVPVIQWGTQKIENTVIAGLPPFFRGNTDIGSWYSRKTARPVNGFLGPNAFNAFRVEIVYAENAVFFEKGPERGMQDMNIVGLTLQPSNEGQYVVIGIAEKGGKPVLKDVEPGDILLQVGKLKVTGATLGTVADALRGNPGDIRFLKLERDGRHFTVKAKVERIL
jgi:hypothetical protein